MRFAKMLDAARDLYDYFSSGGKKAKDTNATLKSIREEEQKQKELRPPWRSTGVSNVPTYNKPSKYQQNSQIKAKIYTGLTKPQGKDTQKPDEDKSGDKVELLDLANHELVIDANGDLVIQPIVYAQQADGGAAQD